MYAREGPGWANSENWLNGPISTWYGVTVEDGRVTALELVDNNLWGSIPVELEYLTELVRLNLSNNNLVSVIPGEIGNLSKLRFLYLGNNQLSGSIPPEIGNLSNLTSLTLSNNHLSGSIPAELGNLQSLLFLSIEDNQLTGPIPPEIGSLTNLRTLALYKNKLSGSLPPEIGQLSNLVSLLLGENQFSGIIPPEIGDLLSLKTLNLGYNKFNGVVPSEINNLTQLSSLWLIYNEFEELPRLDTLDLRGLAVSGNRLTFGDIEKNFDVPTDNFFYSPQDSIGTSIDTSIATGSDFALTVSVGGTANNYQWMKNDSILPGAIDTVLELKSVRKSDSGKYICQISNAIATELILYTRPITVSIIDSISTNLNERQDNNIYMFSLAQNYPNPFNPTTTIRFEIPRAELVSLRIYNLLGQEVRTLIHNQMAAGSHEVQWNGTDDHARMVSSGIYLYRLETNTGFVRTRKLIFLK